MNEDVRAAISASPSVFRVTKLQLGHALVLEALLPSGRHRKERARSLHADEAELRRQVRSQAGAWERERQVDHHDGRRPRSGYFRFSICSLRLRSMSALEMNQR